MPVPRNVHLVGRHELPRKRRKPSVFLVAVAAPAAVFFAAGGDVRPVPAHADAKPIVSDAHPCCFEIVAAKPILWGPDPPPPAAGTTELVSEVAPASRWHRQSRFLPVGVAPERGLQVRTILVARAISEAFPEIHEIGGVRPDPLPWHPNGLAIDVMIPNPGSAQGIALGDEIVAFVFEHASRFGIQDAIWRGVYYTPGGAQPSRLGHYDHVHVTTTGGGYPTGREVYLR